MHWKFIFILVVYLFSLRPSSSTRYYSKAKKLELRNKVREMFHYAYDGYVKYASDFDELRPMTCDGIDTWGSYSLTLIDALDTLATMGNFTEFGRVAKLLEKKMNFDKDLNVSVFETNIRIVGGLLSAHLLSKRAKLDLEPGWPCEGPLLRLAEDVAKRLLPAFDTATHMPYGTINLRYGVPKGETSITCTAGVGTFFIEFGTLSRLTGNPIYEEVALNAVYSLWEKRSKLGLFGNHIDVQSGRWTALDAGIGAGVDSFFEYLVKGAILLNRPELLEMFHEARKAIDTYLKRDDFFVWVNMNKGQVTLPVFQSLEAFWPGILSMVGDIAPAMHTMFKYASIWKKYGFLPEFYNIIKGEAPVNRESYPLRPEFIESAMYLYRATGNQYLLELGEQVLENIELGAKTKCGYATIRNVLTHEKENRMESFFLSETTKYLYLLFDDDNFLHNEGASGEHLETPYGVCAVNAGPYIFNTEAHPMDLSALYCCHDNREDIFEDVDLNMFRDDVIMKKDREEYQAKAEESKYSCRSTINRDEQNPTVLFNSTQENNLNEPQITVDIKVFDDNDNPAGDILVENFERIKNEAKQINADPKTNILTVTDLNKFFGKRRTDFENPGQALWYVLSFLQNFTLDATMIAGLQLFENANAELGAIAKNEFESRTRTLWELYELQEMFRVNVILVKKLGILSSDGTDEKRDTLNAILRALNYSKDIVELDIDIEEDETFRSVLDQIEETREHFMQQVVNTTNIQEFLLRILINGTSDKNRSFKPLLNDIEIKSLPTMPLSEASRLKLFTYVRRMVEFKKRMRDTFAKLQKLMQDNNKSPMQTDEVAFSDQNSDSIEQQIDEFEPPKIDSVHSSDFIPNEPPKLHLSNESESKDNPSVWSQLVQTILRKTTIQREKFDEEKLLKKTRKSLQKYESQRKPLRYQLFTCERPKFIEQFAFRDFYP